MVFVFVFIMALFFMLVDWIARNVVGLVLGIGG